MKKILYCSFLFVFIFCLFGCSENNSEVTEENYTIVWKNDNGEVLEKDENVKKNTIPTYDGKTPEKNDRVNKYLFEGWTPEITPVKENITYTAQYSMLSQNIDIIFIIKNEERKITYNKDTFSLPNIELDKNDIFKGWYFDENYQNIYNENELNTKISSGLTTIYIYAQIIINNIYEVHLISDSYEKIITVMSESDFILPKEDTSGNIFTGWYFDNEYKYPCDSYNDFILKYSEPTTINLYGKKEVTNIEVEYHFNNTDFSLENNHFNSIQEIELYKFDSDIVNINGQLFKFKGWYVDDYYTNMLNNDFSNGKIQNQKLIIYGKFVNIFEININGEINYLENFEELVLPNSEEFWIVNNNLIISQATEKNQLKEIYNSEKHIEITPLSSQMEITILPIEKIDKFDILQVAYLDMIDDDFFADYLKATGIEIIKIYNDDLTQEISDYKELLSFGDQQVNLKAEVIDHRATVIIYSENDNYNTYEKIYGSFYLNDKTDTQYKKFMGYYYDAKFTLKIDTDTIQITQDTEIWEKWEGFSIKISFDTWQEGYGINDRYVNIGEIVTLPKLGHNNFVGWSLTDNTYYLLSDEYTFTENKDYTLYAIYSTEITLYHVLDTIENADTYTTKAYVYKYGNSANVNNDETLSRLSKYYDYKCYNDPEFTEIIDLYDLKDIKVGSSNIYVAFTPKQVKVNFHFANSEIETKYLHYNDTLSYLKELINDEEYFATGYWKNSDGKTIEKINTIEDLDVYQILEKKYVVNKNTIININGKYTLPDEWIIPKTLYGNDILCLDLISGYNTLECNKIIGAYLEEIKNFGSIDKVKEVSFPNLKKISSYAFKDNKFLEKIDLGKITEIPNDCFNGCSSLQAFDFSNIVSIGENAFANCTSLKNIEISPINGTFDYDINAFSMNMNFDEIRITNVTSGSFICRAFAKKVNVEECADDFSLAIYAEDIYMDKQYTLFYARNCNYNDYYKEIFYSNVYLLSTDEINLSNLPKKPVSTNPDYYGDHFYNVYLSEGLEKTTWEEGFTFNNTTVSLIKLPKTLKNFCFSGNINKLIIEDFSSDFECTFADYTMQGYGMGVQYLEYYGEIVSYENFNKFGIFVDLKLPNVKHIDGDALKGYIKIHDNYMINEPIVTIFNNILYKYSDSKNTCKTYQIEDGITSICENAFEGNCSLEEIVIPSSVVKIDGALTKSDTNLSKIILNDSKNFSIEKNFLIETSTGTLLQGFNEYGYMSRVYIPDSVIKVCDNALSICSFEMTLTVGPQVQYWGKNNLSNSDNLEVILFQGYIKELNSPNDLLGWHKSKLRLLELTNVEKIGKDAFQDCQNVETLKLPSNLISIEENALSSFTNLDTLVINGYCRPLKELFGSNYANITIPNVTFRADKMEKGLFEDMKIVSVDMHNAELTTIPENAFKNCTSLQEVKSNANIINFEDYAFYNCENLLNAGFSIMNAGKYAFYNTKNVIDMEMNEKLESLSEHSFDGSNVMTPYLVNNYFANIKNIPAYAFANCTSIGNMKFNSIENIAECAFANSSIGYIEIIDSTTISPRAFENCLNLQVFQFDYIEEVGAYAFSGCNSLESLRGKCEIIRIKDYAFYNCSKLENAPDLQKCSEVGKEAFYQVSAIYKASKAWYFFDKTFGDEAFGNMYINFCYVDEKCNINAFKNCDSKSTILYSGTEKVNDYITSNVKLENIKEKNSMIYLIDGENITGVKYLETDTYTEIEDIVEINDISYNLIGLYPNIVYGTNLQYVNRKYLNLMYDTTSGAYNGDTKYQDVLTPYVTIINGKSVIKDNIAYVKLSYIKYGGYFTYSCIMGYNYTIETGKSDYSKLINVKLLYNINIYDENNNYVESIQPKIIVDKAFTNLTIMETLTNNAAINRIGDEAFYRCQNLKEFNVDIWIDYIGSNCFTSCPNLTIYMSKLKAEIVYSFGTKWSGNSKVIIIDDAKN